MCSVRISYKITSGSLYDNYADAKLSRRSNVWRASYPGGVVYLIACFAIGWQIWVFIEEVYRTTRDN
jgi:hypothetical protein